MMRTKVAALSSCILFGLVLMLGAARPSRADDDPKATLRADAKLLADALAKLPPDGTLERVSTLLRLGMLQHFLNDSESARLTLRRGLEEAGRAERSRITESPIDPPGRILILTNLARAMVVVGDLDSARQAVEQAGRLLDEHPVADNRQILSYLAVIARAQAKLGDPDAAWATLSRLRTATAGAEPQNRLLGLMQLIEAKARMGDFDGAFGLALAPPSEFEGVWDEQLRAGDTQTLSALARGIEPEHGEEGKKAVQRLLRVPVMTTQPGVFIEHRYRNGLLAEIARAQLRLGDIESALTTIDSMDHDDDRAVALVAVADAQVEAQRSEAARATLHEALGRAQRGTPDPYRDGRFVQIAVMQARAGDAQGAMETLRLSKEDNPIAVVNVMVLAARTLSRAGDGAGAEELLRKARQYAEERKGKPLTVPGVPDEAEGLGRLEAQYQAQLGDFETALRLAEAIKSARPRQQAFLTIALYQVDAGDTAGALAWIARRPPSEQSGVLEGAILGLTGRANLPAALRSFP